MEVLTNRQARNKCGIIPMVNGDFGLIFYPTSAIGTEMPATEALNRGTNPNGRTSNIDCPRENGGGPI
jgi:hypothetical protein